MKVTFWGTRGSIPTPGNETVKYGGNTTCLEVRLSDGSLIIFDAGTGIRRLGSKLIRNDERFINIFLTHPHWDHIQGFPFFEPMYKKGYRIWVHGWPTTNRKVKNTITDQMEGTYHPVDFSQLAAEIEFIEIEDLHLDYNSARMSFLRCNHPVICHSIKIEDHGRSFVFMTDNELDSVNPITRWEEFVEFCRGADLLVHDAQFTPEEAQAKRGWGHSSYRRALHLARDAQVKSLALFHHDPEHSDSAVDEIVSSSQRAVREQNLPFSCFGAREGLEIEI
jgi:phosphoribosyl 1,2-cyclic phosphodiesterase